MLFEEFDEELYKKVAEDYAAERYNIGENNGKNTEKIDVIIVCMHKKVKV